MGDATPLCWGDEVAGLQPDVLIVPYPYVTTRIGWQTTMRFDPKAVVLVHMPAKEFDPDGIWPAVETVLDVPKEIPVWSPALGETIILE